jgi:DNA-binding CsgD family transcriptional regulator
MRTKTNYIVIFIFLVFVLALWLVFLALPKPVEVGITEAHGSADAKGVDLQSNIISVVYKDWDSYPGKLYTPGDFAAVVDERPTPFDIEDYRRVEYATHRLELNIPAGDSYALLIRSSDYAMRIYINGKPEDTVGYPSDSKETNIPRVAERMYTFTPETDKTEIIVQASNWVHREGAYPSNLRIGALQNLNAVENRNLIISFLITGGLLTAFLYHLGLFVLNRGRRPVLVFSLCCLLLALMSNQLIPAFFPEYDWTVAIGLEYIVHFLTFAMLVLFLKLLFPRLYNRYVTRAYFALSGVFILLTFLLAPKVYTGLLMIFDSVSILMVLYTLIRLGMQLREKKLQNTLAFIGIALVCLFGVIDILSRNNIITPGVIAGQQFATPIAMLFFVFCYGLVVSIDHAETEQKMLAAQHMVREAEERYNALLEQQSDMQPHAVPADFKLSPRETDVLWLLLDGKSRQEIAVLLALSMGSVNTYCNRVYQKTDVNSMGGLFKIFGLNKKG